MDCSVKDRGQFILGTARDTVNCEINVKMAAAESSMTASSSHQAIEPAKLEAVKAYRAVSIATFVIAFDWHLELT